MDQESSPLVLADTKLDELSVNGGESYLFNVKDFRRTRPEFYAMRSAIQVLRNQAVTYLDGFFQKAHDKGLTVCVIIHGFTSDHRSMQDNIGSLKSLQNNTKIVLLYIDWDTNVATKSLLFLQGMSRIITNGVNNAYDIHELVRKSIQMHARRNSEDTEKLSVIVMAHSMGSHVAEAFIKEHESINLRGVIYFNPHADHTLYNLQAVDHLYMSHTKKKGFVLVFASSHDRVLAGSAKLQQVVRSFFSGIFNFQNTYIRPLGCSWEKYRDKATKDGHRVVVLHMKHKPSYRFSFWYPFHDILNHSSFKYTPCRKIANAAVNLAMTKDTFGIKKVLALVQNEHLLEPKEVGGVIPPRPFGIACEYVNMEHEKENTMILSDDCAKIKKLDSPLSSCSSTLTAQSSECGESEDESAVNETTPLNLAV